MSEEKLSESIEAFLSVKEQEMSPNALVYRLSPWPSVFVSGSLLIFGSVLFGQKPLIAKVCLWFGLIFVILMVERRRVCRIEIDGGGLRAHNLLGRVNLEIHRQSVQEVVLEEGAGKDYYVVAGGRSYRIPTLYDGFHHIVAILENWASENGRGSYSPRT